MSTLAQRSVLGRSGTPLDQIHIAGIAARGFHGVLESERAAGQDFSADVTLYLDTRPAARGDDLTETVNYALVAQDVADILSGAPVNLIETVAEQIAAAVLARPVVVAVDVTVHKPQAPIPVPFDDVVVAIHRDRINVAVVASPLDAGVAQATQTSVVSEGLLHEERAENVAVPAGSVTGDDEAAERVEPVGSVEPVEAAEDESAPAWQEPVPMTTTAFPMVITRQAEPFDEVNTAFVAPQDASLDARLDAPLDARLDAPLQALPALEPDAAFEPDAEPVPDVEVTTPPLGIGLTAVLPPLDEDVLAEQARLSEQTRRPEVFGMSALSSDWAPPITPDSVSASSQIAPEDFLTAETFTLDDVAQPPASAPVADEAMDTSEPSVTEVADGSDVEEAAALDEPLAADEAPTMVFAAAPVAADPGDPTDASAADDLHEDDLNLYEDDLNATTVLPRAFDRMDIVAAEPVEVVLALGANLGDAQSTLRRAVADLGGVAGLTVTAVGPLARTAPVGGPDQPDFLNTVLLATTTLSPRDLLHACQSIEAEHGRQRLEHWGPRTLDIDVIAYGTLVHTTDDLDIPHPRANERAFVLAPWAHLSPEAVLPGLGGGPVGALAATAPDRDGIRWLALDWLSEPDSSSRPPASIQPTGTAHGTATQASASHASPVQQVDDPDGDSAAVPPAPPL